MKNDVYRYYSYMLPPLCDARYKDALFIILSFGKFQGPVTDEKEEQIMRKNTACFLSQVCHLTPLLRSFSHGHWWIG